jgi:hypothetical protein
MGGRPVVNRNIELFNNQIRRMNTRQLATNTATTNPFWTDYNWSNAQSDAFTDDWHDEWVNTLYPDYLNPDKNHAAVKKSMHKFIEDFDDWLHQELLITKIVACGKANDTDADIFNVVLVRSAPTSRDTQIPAKCFAEVEGAGRGVMECWVRSKADQTRPSVPLDDGADSVQYAWAVVDKETEAIKDLNDPRLVKVVNKHAHFQFDADSKNQGKWLVIYFRWYNTSHPELAGVWSTMVVTVIA